MENKERLELLKKIAKIQEQIKDLARDETNKFQNYKYFEESQILKTLKPLLAKHKVALVVSDDDTQPFTHEREGNNHFIKYLKKLELTDLENGALVVYKYWASGSGQDLAKLKGAVETYSMKYILSKFFLIRVIDENDPDLKESKEKLKSRIITAPQTLQERQEVRKLANLKDNAWWCKRCDYNKPREPYKLADDRPDIKASEIIKALANHGEIQKLWK